MGSYDNDDDALIGLARQLMDAYGEARRRADQDYACESIAEYLSEFRDAAPSEALLAILGLPLTAETYPLVDEAQVALAARGTAVVEPLLEAVLGDVYDPDGSAPERAAETLDAMDPHEASIGLCAVLCGRGDDQLKGAAVDGLVALGAVAEPDLVSTLDDPEGGDWARAALEQLRFEREHPGMLDDVDDGAGNDGAELDDGACEAATEEVPGESEAAAEEAPREPEADAEVLEGDDAGDEAVAGPAEDERADGGAGPTVATGGATPAGAPGVVGPDQGLVDDAYDDFLRRFEQESGGESSAS
jgi:hypothetical protein